MKVEVKRIDKSLPLPSYNSKDTVKLGLTSRKDIIIEARETHSVPLNIIVAVPKGHLFIISPTDEITQKGITFSGGTLILDSSDNKKDELALRAFNFSGERAMILKGEVVAYGAFVKAEKAS